MHFSRSRSVDAKFTLSWLLIVAVVPSWIPLLASPPRRDTPSHSRSIGLSPTEKREVPAKKVIEDYGKLPLGFELNKGQLDPAVKFFARGPGYGIFLTQQGLVMELRNEHRQAPDKAQPEHRLRKETSKPQVVTIKVPGSNLHPTVAGLEELPGKNNYFIGNDPKQWRTDVSNYAKVKYSDVYPGVDMIYYGNNGQLEYDFIVGPGADPKAIKLSFDGVERLSLDENGDLLVSSGGSVLRQHKPVVFQEIAGGRRKIESSYRILDQRQVTFEVGDFEHDKPLIIDPVLTYSTYLGGSGDDYLGDIALDSAGNVYVIGYTYSTNFPRLNAYQNTAPGTPDLYVTKINAAGTALLYSTYVGGSSNEFGGAITVDASGVAYVAAESWSNNFPTVNAYQPAHSAIADVVLFKLGASGNTLLYSTYLGGSQNDTPFSIGVDSSGNMYVGGQTQSSNFPVANAYQPTFGGGTCGSQSCYDAFVTKFNPAGSSLIYSTFLGGSNDDSGSIVLGAGGVVYIAGSTLSANFPKVNPLQSTLGGGRDVFVTLLDAAGTGLVFSTYIGGQADDSAGDAALDSDGNLYVTGLTSSTNFPTVNAFQSTVADVQDGFVFKLSASGNALLYSTYLGGHQVSSSSIEYGSDITVDADGNAYVTGNADSDDFPVVDPILSCKRSDPFVAKISPSGSALLFSTCIGGAASDYGRSIALSPSGDIYVGGETLASDFPTAAPIQATHGGGSSPSPRDAFLFKIGTDNGFSISGQIADAGGNPIPSVTVSLTGRQTGTVFTDAAGFYSFPHLLTGNYTLTPSKSFVTFTPASQTFNNLTSNQTADFTGSVSQVTLNGKVKDANGTGVAGVTVSLSGSQTGSQLSDAQGNYTFSNLSAGGNYTLTPSRNADTFTPVSKSFTNLSSNQTVDFKLVYKISGQVTDSIGTPVSGVTITLSGAQTGSAFTDLNGNYSFLNLSANASYTVTPSKPGYTLTYTFTPSSQTFSSLNVNAVANFSFTTATTVSLNPVADAYVQDGTATGTNFGAVTPMLLKTANQADQRRDVYLRYDLTPASRKITSAKLRIFAALSAAGSVSTSAYSVSDLTWAESAITWTNKPVRNSTAITGATATVLSTTYATYDLDVSAYVLSEKSAGRDIISIALHNPSNSTPNIFLNSREAAANKPQLVLTTVDSNNTAPTVSVTNPANGASFNAPATVSLSATASDADGSITKVEYYSGNSSIGSATVSPFNVSWPNVPTGSYTIRAVATDNSGLSTVSSAVQITVNNSNIPPAVSITAPLAGTNFPAGANISINADASDLDGNVTQVEFFNGATSLGTDNSAPYSFAWNNIPAGALSLTARATDNSGGTTTSTAVIINSVSQTGLSAAADAYVRDGSSATTNFGTALELHTQQGLSGSNRESYLRFDLTAVNSIARAKLRLFGRLSDTSGTNVPVGIYSVANITWAESGTSSITWNTKPVSSASPLSTTTVTDNVGRWYEFDVTSYIQSEKAVPRNVVSFALKSLASSSPFVIFNSREAANQKPQLVLWTTQARTALFAVGSSNLSTADAAMKTRLENLGFTVTAKVANNNLATVDADGKTVVVISSSVTASSVLAKFRYVAVPVVSWEFDILDDMLMTPSPAGNFGTTAATETVVNITNATHPLAAGLSGPTQVAGTATSFTYGVPPAGAVNVASINNDAGKSAIFAYDRDATMVNLDAPARRVSLFMTDATAGSFNSNGNSLFDAAIKWATEVKTAPTIESLTPATGPVGTSLTINGFNFGLTQGSSSLSLNAIAITPLTWNDRAITTSIPNYATTGPILVTVNGIASNIVTFTVGPVDSDADGLPDLWELQYFGNLNQTANGDPDADGLTNLQEYQQGRNPTVNAITNDGAIQLKLFTPLASPTP
jgi:hypothetical protein